MLTEPATPRRRDPDVEHWEGVFEAILMELRLEDDRPIPPAQRGLLKQEFCGALQSVWKQGVDTGQRMRRMQQRATEMTMTRSL